MLALIDHVRTRLNELLDKPSIGGGSKCDIDLDAFELAETAHDIVEHLGALANEAALQSFRAAVRDLASSDSTTLEAVAAVDVLPVDVLREIASRPGAVAWSQTLAAQAAERSVHAVDGAHIQADGAYLRWLLDDRGKSSLRVGQDDPWLRAPFGAAIRFEDEALAAQARPIVEAALEIIRRWRPSLAAEMRLACRAIQFIRDPLAHPEKIVSFSDNTVPGALYVSVVQGDGFIDPYDLADSLIHEHRHQKLYLLERQAPTVEPGASLVASPWREDLRPASGLLHAVFVFVELRRFWLFVRDEGLARLQDRAIHQLLETEDHLTAAFATLQTCPLTALGRRLVDVLHAAAGRELVPT